MLKRGAADAALAGSGSAVFGVFRNPAQARRAARAFPEDSVFVVETLSREKYGRALGWSAVRTLLTSGLLDGENALVDGKNFKVFCGTANPPLADAICRYLGVPRGRAEHGHFSDGETRYQILENVRGADVFVVQPCCIPVDLHLMQLLLMIDAFKRASAWRITPVIPYYPYARQDRKDRPRVAISAKLVADLLETAGASRVLSLDLHAPQIQGYFNIPVDHLYARAGAGGIFSEEEAGPDHGGFAGCGRRGARAAFCEEHRRAAGDRR